MKVTKESANSIEITLAVEMTPEEHDQLAAKTQGITHFVGRVLKDAGVGVTEIDTLGSKTF